MSVRRLRQLGVVWEAVRRTAPTRPRPVVARRQPGNVAAALHSKLDWRRGLSVQAEVDQLRENVDRVLEEVGRVREQALAGKFRGCT